MSIARALALIAALLALPFGAFAGAGPARAGALSVMPVRVEVAAGRRFCALTLGNGSDKAIMVQVRAFAWRRDESGADLLDADAAFALNPAIATIAPGAERMVRCSLPAADLATRGLEGSWRLIVDQLPDPDYAVPGTVQTLLRLSIPVFRAPEGAVAAPRLAAARAGQGVRLSNAGTVHVKVLAVRLKGTDGDAVTVERPFYLLAGGAQIVPADRLPRGGVAAVHVRAEEGAFDLALGPVP
jgi:fimbrial chaperone protein